MERRGGGLFKELFCGNFAAYDEMWKNMVEPYRPQTII
jgi:hypothetical protein